MDVAEADRPHEAARAFLGAEYDIALLLAVRLQLGMAIGDRGAISQRLLGAVDRRRHAGSAGELVDGFLGAHLRPPAVR